MPLFRPLRRPPPPSLYSSHSCFLFFLVLPSPPPPPPSIPPSFPPLTPSLPSSHPPLLPSPPPIPPSFPPLLPSPPSFPPLLHPPFLPSPPPPPFLPSPTGAAHHLRVRGTNPRRRKTGPPDGQQLGRSGALWGSQRRRGPGLRVAPLPERKAHNAGAAHPRGAGPVPAGRVLRPVGCHQAMDRPISPGGPRGNQHVASAT